MIVLALDTTTRAGSVALARDGVLLEAFAGDATRTHATRLPGDILGLLGRHQVTLADIDLFAVAAGPGSFTGLRIGIATIQGLAFASQKRVVAVSALEALAHATDIGAQPRSGRPRLVGAWMDAQRQEVYAELFEGPALDVAEPAAVDGPERVLDTWAARVAADQGADLLLLGDGAVAYRAIVEARLPRATVPLEVPLLAPAIALLAAQAEQRGMAGPPHAIRPLYVRRPDAELARDRRRAAEPRQGTDGTPVSSKGHDSHG